MAVGCFERTHAEWHHPQSPRRTDARLWQFPQMDRVKLTSQLPRNPQRRRVATKINADLLVTFNNQASYYYNNEVLLKLLSILIVFLIAWRQWPEHLTLSITKAHLHCDVSLPFLQYIQVTRWSISVPSYRESVSDESGARKKGKPIPFPSISPTNPLTSRP